MATWKRLPQECIGDYCARARTVRRRARVPHHHDGITCPTFSGQALMTRGVEAMLSPEEIAFIVADLHAFAEQLALKSICSPEYAFGFPELSRFDD